MFLISEKYLKKTCLSVTRVRSTDLTRNFGGSGTSPSGDVKWERSHLTDYMLMFKLIMSFSRGFSLITLCNSIVGVWLSITNMFVQWCCSCDITYNLESSTWWLQYTATQFITAFHNEVLHVTCKRNTIELALYAILSDRWVTGQQLCYWRICLP